MTRRALVGAAPMAVVTAGLPALAFGKDLDAELLAFGEPYERTLAAIQTLGSAYAQAEERYFAQRKACSSLDEKALSALTGVNRAEDDYHSALDRSNLAIERIIATPARTIRGLAFKAMVARWECNGLPELIDSIIADLIAIGAESEWGHRTSEHQAAAPLRGAALPDHTSCIGWMPCGARSSASAGRDSLQSGHDTRPKRAARRGRQATPGQFAPILVIVDDPRPSTTPSAVAFPCSSRFAAS